MCNAIRYTCSTVRSVPRETSYRFLNRNSESTPKKEWYTAPGDLSVFNYLHEYRSLQWGNNQFSSKKDTYERDLKKTFRKADHHRLTHGYGAMRDSSVQLRSVLNSVDASMMAFCVIMPGPRTEAGQPVNYLAFVQCDSEELKILPDLDLRASQENCQDANAEVQLCAERVVRKANSMPGRNSRCGSTR